MSSQLERWWVVFTDKGKGRYSLFTEKGCRHCYCFTNRKDGFMEYFEPKHDRLISYAFAGWAFGHVKTALMAGSQVFVVDVPARPYARETFLQDLSRAFLMTCSNLVAYRLGIQKGCITPVALRKAVIAAGGHELKLSDRERKINHDDIFKIQHL